ncbi:MAG: DNA polymerase III subunit gamma/tau [Pseudomonadota bacterium]
MSDLGSGYQVLARKWRPRRFEDMVGQEHVLRALTTALDEQRLHHAYLFTGTRGVGKTTVARIFAKALNCEQGVSSRPCGVCSSCVAIDEGRFVDLIEVDAASRTGVDDTRDLLDNVQYLPSAGRFKVYLIDEVHMFSKSSFNALLKTLEEPPPHVKFLLATTDPHKLPVTVLSRCLQFHLKALPRRMIFARLAQVLTAEGIPFDEAALQLLARAAEGSVRDALSLLDQAIAYGQGRVLENEVGAMLGLTSEAHLRALVLALVAQDAPALFAAIGLLAQGAPDYAEVLAELLQLLHALAVQQLMPQADAELFEASPQLVDEFAAQISPEAVQLLYQIALHGRRDLPLAPSPRLGLEMTLMRMLAFVPQDEATQPANPASGRSTAIASPPKTEPLLVQERAQAPSARSAPPAAMQEALQAAGVMPRTKPAEKAQATTQVVQASEPVAQSAQPKAIQMLGDWHDVLPRLALKGMVLQLAENLELVAQEGDKITLRCPKSHASVRSQASEKAIAQALGQLLGLPGEARLQWLEGEVQQATPAQLRQQAADARQAQAVESLRNDPVVRALEENYGGRLLVESVRPLQND